MHSVPDRPRKRSRSLPHVQKQTGKANHHNNRCWRRIRSASPVPSLSPAWQQQIIRRSMVTDHVLLLGLSEVKDLLILKSASRSQHSGKLTQIRRSRQQPSPRCPEPPPVRTVPVPVGLDIQLFRNADFRDSCYSWIVPQHPFFRQPQRGVIHLQRFKQRLTQIVCAGLSCNPPELRFPYSDIAPFYRVVHRE